MITQLPIFSKSLSYLITVLENESAEAINWLKQDNMLVNPKKFKYFFCREKRDLLYQI